MPEHLILRLEGPLQAWGDVALDPRRPTLPLPSRSGLAGLLGNALGWRYRDADRLTALQDALWLAVREERPATVLLDFQTADLDDSTKDRGWTSWGKEDRGSGTQILNKEYLADALFRVALALREPAPVSLGQLAEALRRPARPLFLGRKGCPPGAPILERTLSADCPLAALRSLPADHHRLRSSSLRCWYDATASELRQTTEVWDRRDFRTNRFAGSRRLAEIWLAVSDLPGETP